MADRDDDNRRAENPDSPEPVVETGSGSDDLSGTGPDLGKEPAEAVLKVMPHSPASPASVLGAPSSEREEYVHPPIVLRGPRRRRVQEQLVAALLFLASSVSVVTTIGIVAVLLLEASRFFLDVSIVEFLTGTEWAPLFQPQHFGVVPLLVGSILVSVIAALVALPVGLGSAIYLSEYASQRARRIIKPALEVLAGVPTVIYGYFALTFVTPLIRKLWPDTSIFNALSASLVMGVMIIPLVASLSEDAMRAVPRALRESAYALGATKLEVSLKAVLPAALSGIVASFVLALSRAIGETMIVAIAAGATPNLTLNPLESIQTMTAYMVQVSMGEVVFGSVEYQTIFAVGLALFAITLLMNMLSIAVLRRFREVYE